MSAATLFWQREAAATRLKTWFPSAVAREVMQVEDGGPLWDTEWDRVLMMHWSVPVEVLQKAVPFPLDVREGRAWVSAVAFCLRGMRLAGRVGLLGKWSLPFTHHAFLNLRTYVKVGSESGIFFLREWVPAVPSIPLSRPLYGLPFSRGRLSYHHTPEQGKLAGEVMADGSRLTYEAEMPGAFDTCEAGSLTEFLMERYTAFTEWRGWKRRFHVWHPPWRQSAVSVRLEDASLLGLTGEWASQARYEGANYSPGLPSVWMGAPRELEAAELGMEN
jgi:hypothetical protein